MTKISVRILALLFALLLSFSALFGCVETDNSDSGTKYADTNGDTLGDGYGTPDSDSSASSSNTDTDSGTSGTPIYGYASVEGIPDYSGSPYVVLNNNVPEFRPDEIVRVSYEKYAPLDALGRCGVTVACVGKDIMPTEDRESISSVKPSGWINKQYDTSLVDGGYLYNRCHLIGFQLTGENANKQNLITGTRYMNVDGMLPFENMVADYVKETGNHVMYRVTPIFVGDNLVASGVQMEACSVEDSGAGIYFNVFVYNVQPGIVIDYKTGDNALSGEALPDSGSNETDSGEEKDYVLNTNTKKIHIPSCSSATSMNPSNRQEYKGYISDLWNQGYTSCGICKAK